MRAEGRLAFGQQRVDGIIRRCTDIVPRSAMREVAALARGVAEGWALTRVPPVVRQATLMMYGYYVVVSAASSSCRSAGGLRQLASAVPV